MADEQAKSQPPIVVVEQQETPLAKNEKEPHKGQMSIAPSVVSGKPVKGHHASVHKSEHRSEAIELTTLQIEKKRGVIIPSSQPIPADVKSVHSSDSALDQDKKSTKGEGKEIDETGGKKQKHGNIKEKDLEWDLSPRCASPAVIVPEEISTTRSELNDIDDTLQELKKKEVSWNKQRVQENEQYQVIDLQSNSLTLVRKASVGPCRTFSGTGRPSGISINIPRKSLASVSAKLEEHDVINEPQNSEVKTEGERKSVFFSFLKRIPAMFRKK